MKTLTIPIFLAFCITFNACKSPGGRAFETAEGVAGIVKDLNSEFGDNASYTSVGLGYHKDLGTTISATGTKDPSSNKLIKKQRTNGSWRDLSEIKMSVDKIKKEKNFDAPPLPPSSTIKETFNA